MVTTETISLLLPTRGRPQLAERFLNSAAASADKPESIEALIYADQDDLESHRLHCERIRTQVIVGPRDSMGAYNTSCFKHSIGQIIVLANDDVIVRTSGWDRRLREVHGSFADQIYLAYPNDLYKGRSLCAFPILSRRTCDLLGEPFPRAYAGAFIDYHLLDIFRRLEHAGERRILYLPDVVFEHMHFRAGKGVLDDTYLQRRRFGDDHTFLALRMDRSRASRVLIAAVKGVEAASVCSTVVTTLAAPCGVLKGGFMARLLELKTALLSDTELPWRWRLSLFMWFVGRFLAAKGCLPARFGSPR